MVKQLKINIKSPGKISRSFFIPNHTTIEQLRSRLRTTFEFDENTPLKVYLDAKEIKDVQKTLGDYKASDGSTLTIKQADPDEVRLGVLMLGALQLGLGGLGISPQFFETFKAKVDEVGKKAGPNKTNKWAIFSPRNKSSSSSSSSSLPVIPEPKKKT